MKRLITTLLACLTLALTGHAQTYSGNTITQLDPTRPPDTGEAQKYGAAAIREIKRALLNSSIGTNSTSDGNVKSFGAVGDGVTDDSAAVQRAIDAGAGVVYFPGGTYNISNSTLVVSNGCHIYGEGPYVTAVRSSNASTNMWNITATSSVLMENFLIGTLGNLVKSNGTFIVVQPPAGGINTHSIFRNLFFQGGWQDIQFLAASIFTVETCQFTSYGNFGVDVQNLVSADTGDSAILNNIFDGDPYQGVAIGQESSGGLRVQGNKLLGGNYHYLGQYNSGAATGDLLLQNNSSEGANVANFAFNASAGSTFLNVLVQNNQIAVGTTNGATGIEIQNPGYLFLATILIGGNTLNIGPNSTGMFFDNGRLLTLDINVFQGAGTNTLGVVVTSNVTSIACSSQVMSNLSNTFIESGTIHKIAFTPLP